MATHHMPHEGAGWKTHFWGDWISAATSLHAFDVIACTPTPMAVAIGFFFGTAHFLAGLAKPVPWAPSIGESPGGTPHGGRKGGRNREQGKPKATWRTVFNLPAETQFEIEGGLQMALFGLGGVALEVGYIIFLADLWRDSLLIGTSAAYRYGGCVRSVNGQSEGTVDWIAVPQSHPTLNVVDWSVKSDPGHLLGVNTITVPAGASLGLTYSLTLSPYMGQPLMNLQFFLVDVSAGSIVSKMGTPEKEPGADGTVHVGNHGHLPVDNNDRTYQIWYYLQTTGFAHITGVVWAWDALSVNYGLLFDP
jgi:hypothetical protein